MSEELKPCPFCDSKNIKVHSYSDAVIGGEPDAFAQCHDCSVTGPNGKTEAEAAQAWNTRAITQRPAPGVPMEWPKGRDVGRFGDMSKSAHIRVGLDSDNDVYVSVWDEDGGASVEFVNPGGGGGGSSRRTREALIALMVAMEADNANRPDKDWWARRNGTAQAKGDAP